MSKSVDNYPGSVTFEVRITVPTESLSKQVEALEKFLDKRNITYNYLPGESLHTP